MHDSLALCMEFGIISLWFIIDLFKIFFGLKIYVGEDGGGVETSLKPRVLSNCKKSLDTAKASEQPDIST